MQVSGTLKAISPQQQFGDKFVKRAFVIETDEKYPQTIQLELHNSAVDLIDDYRIGQGVECEINLRGRAWENPQGETKYFNTIVCWKIKLIRGAVSETATADLEDDEIPF